MTYWHQTRLGIRSRYLNDPIQNKRDEHFTRSSDFTATFDLDNIAYRDQTLNTYMISY